MSDLLEFLDKLEKKHRPLSETQGGTTNLICDGCRYNVVTSCDTRPLIDMVHIYRELYAEIYDKVPVDVKQTMGSYLIGIAYILVEKEGTNVYSYPKHRTRNDHT